MGHHEFIAHLSMARSLYSRSENPKHPKGGLVDASGAQEAIMSKVSSMRSFEGTYFSYLTYLISSQFCCCFYSMCFNRTGSCKRRNKKWNKLGLAREKLMKEHDIQHIIQASRVARFLHKAAFRRRQRKGINVNDKFVITDEDIRKAERRAEKGQPAVEAWPKPDHKFLAHELINGFDPENEKKDRRTLYEITGLRLYLEEFQEDDSSDSGDEALDSDGGGSSDKVVPL